MKPGAHPKGLGDKRVNACSQSKSQPALSQASQCLLAHTGLTTQAGRAVRHSRQAGGGDVLLFGAHRGRARHERRLHHLVGQDQGGRAATAARRGRRVLCAQATGRWRGSRTPLGHRAAAAAAATAAGNASSLAGRASDRDRCLGQGRSASAAPQARSACACVAELRGQGWRWSSAGLQWAASTFVGPAGPREESYRVVTTSTAVRHLDHLGLQCLCLSASRLCHVCCVLAPAASSHTSWVGSTAGLTHVKTKCCSGALTGCASVLVVQTARQLAAQRPHRDLPYSLPSARSLPCSPAFE